MAVQVVKLTEWTKDIINSVEEDLKKELKQMILDNPNWGWEQLSIQDVFGCAINQLSPVYIKKGMEPDFRYDKDELRAVISFAMNRVKANPIHLSKEE